MAEGYGCRRRTSLSFSQFFFFQFLSWLQFFLWSCYTFPVRVYYDTLLILGKQILRSWSFSVADTWGTGRGRPVQRIGQPDEPNGPAGHLLRPRDAQGQDRSGRAWHQGGGGHGSVRLPVITAAYPRAVQLQPPVRVSAVWQGAADGAICGGVPHAQSLSCRYYRAQEREDSGVAAFLNRSTARSSTASDSTGSAPADTLDSSCLLANCLQSCGM